MPATPYQVAVTPKGAQLSYGFKRRRATSEAQLDPFGVDWFVQPVSDGGDAATVAADAASRVKRVETEAGGFVAAGDALYGASNRTTNATLERRSAVGAAERVLAGSGRVSRVLRFRSEWNYRVIAYCWRWSTATNVATISLNKVGRSK